MNAGFVFSEQKSVRNDYSRSQNSLLQFNKYHYQKIYSCMPKFKLGYSLAFKLWNDQRLQNHIKTISLLIKIYKFFYLTLCYDLKCNPSSILYNLVKLYVQGTCSKSTYSIQPVMVDLEYQDLCNLTVMEIVRVLWLYDRGQVHVPANQNDVPSRCHVLSVNQASHQVYCFRIEIHPNRHTR